MNIKNLPITREDIYNDLIGKGPMMLDDLISYLDTEYGQDGWTIVNAPIETVQDTSPRQWTIEIVK